MIWELLGGSAPICVVHSKPITPNQNKVATCPTQKIKLHQKSIRSISNPIKSQISTYNHWFTSFVPRVSIGSSPPRAPMHLPSLHRRGHPDARKASQHCAGGAEATAPPSRHQT